MKPTADDPEAVPQHLFAYGTLQPGLAPSAVRPWVDRLLSIGPGSATGTLYDLGDYPGAIFDGGGTVHGRAYRLPAGHEAVVLAATDDYEGVPDLYVRLTVPVTLAGGKQLTCWAYQYNHDIAGGARIPSGVYVARALP